MKPKSILLISFVLLTLTISLSGCNSEGEATVGNEETEAKRVISVEATVVEPSDIDITKTFSGALEGERQADIYAKLSEAVEKINVSEGEGVNANQTIISLDPNGPSSGLTAAKSVYLNSEKNFNKMSNLYKEGAISESNFDAARTQFEVDQANYQSIAQLIDIRSPIAGVLTSVDVNVGQYVVQGQKVATVASIDKLRLKFAVNADEIGLFKQGARVIVSSDLTAKTASGVVKSTAGSANPDTRAFEVEAIIENHAGNFRPGMFVHVDYLAESVKDAIVVDRTSVVNLDGKSVAFTVKDGQAVRHDLTLGEVMNGHQIVLSGLMPGDTLVTVGQAYLADDTPIKITKINGR
jgi:RND family efflux transporter MFP subunit